MFKLTIETDNAAFEGDSLPHEIARILRDAANQVQGCRMSGRLFDANGNRVGSYDITEEG